MNQRGFMNKRISFVLALCLLVSGMPVQAISNTTAAIATVLAAPISLFAMCGFLGGGLELDDTARIAGGGVGGAAAITAGAHVIISKFTPSGRYERANKIVEKLKGKYSRVFTDGSRATQDQLFNELNGFHESYKNERNFASLNVLKTLDTIELDLKKAESLLVQAKKDNGCEALETLFYVANKCKKTVEDSASKVYAYFAKTRARVSLEEINKPLNHIELEPKIDALLIEVRAMQNKVARIYGDIELSPAFKQQLKEYEGFRAQRSQNTRSNCINGAIVTATVTIPALAALVIISSITVKIIMQDAIARARMHQEVTY